MSQSEEYHVLRLKQELYRDLAERTKNTTAVQSRKYNLKSGESIAENADTAEAVGWDLALAARLERHWPIVWSPVGSATGFAFADKIVIVIEVRRDFQGLVGQNHVGDKGGGLAVVRQEIGNEFEAFRCQLIKESHPVLLGQLAREDTAHSEWFEL